MSDNLFDRLAELLSSSGPVNWGLAGELGGSVAGEPGVVPAGSQEHWRGLVDTASRVLSDSSAIDLTPGAAVSLDRRQWTDQAMRGFDYLAEPLAAKLGSDQDNPFTPMFSIMVGLQIGSMVGSISHRALANFDAALPPIGATTLRFIAPNIEEFTATHDLEPQQAHLWIAAHELVQARLLGQPGMADRFRSLVGDYLAGLELNPESLPFDGIEAGFDPEKLSQMVQDPSFLTGIFTGPHQAEDLADIQAFLATVEGYVDHLLNQLDTKLMPQLPRIREAVDRRRATPSQGEVLLQKMLGIELRRPEYRTGAAFFEEIERRWGPDASLKVWASDGSVPTGEELADPVAWAARVLL